MAISSCRMEAPSAPAQQRAQEVLGGLVLTDGGLERIAIDRDVPPDDSRSAALVCLAQNVWQRPPRKTNPEAR